MEDEQTDGELPIPPLGYLSIEEHIYIHVMPPSSLSK